MQTYKTLLHRIGQFLEECQRKKNHRDVEGLGEESEREKGKREKEERREGEGRGNSHRVHRKACSVPIKAAATLAQLVVDPVPFAVRVRECEGVTVECEGVRCGCVW